MLYERQCELSINLADTILVDRVGNIFATIASTHLMIQTLQDWYWHHLKEFAASFTPNAHEEER